MTSKITPFKVTQLPIKQENINLFLYKYKSKKSIKNNDIRQVAEKLTAEVQSKLDTAGLDFSPQIMVTQLYDKSLGWQSGGFSNADEPVKFYDFESEYEYNGDRIQNEFKNFNLAIKLVPNSGGCDGNYNDCLWYCLRKIVNNDAAQLPKAVRTQARLKRFLKVDRYDPVHVSHIPLLENKMKMNLHLVGDKIKRSTKNYKQEAVLLLKNGHYTNQRQAVSKQLRGATNTEDKEIVMYEEVVTESGVEHWAYAGERRYQIEREGLTAFRMMPLSCRKIYRAVAKPRNNITIPLEEQYAAYISDAEELFDKSNGLVNLHRQLNEKKSALFVFAKLKQGFKEPEPITIFEGRWLHNARSGGLIKATPACLEYGISYDINKMYSAMMTHDKFTFPAKEGTFATLNQHELEGMTFFQYGIYKCKLSNPNNVSTKLFLYSEAKSYHTHFSLTTARELGIKITMVEDGQPNALLFKGGRIHGKQIFGPFVKFMMEVHSKVQPETKPRCKNIMNCLWGGLNMLNNSRIDLNKEESINLEHREITHIEPHRDKYLVNLHDYVNKYKTDYARLGPFLTSFARRQMYLTFKDVEECVYRVHTDGVVVSKKLPLPLGAAVGEWKVEFQGRCEVVNANKVVWL